MDLHPCPCCREETLTRGEPGTYERCPVCGWEDDGVQFDDPNRRGGANRESLNEARDAYVRAMRWSGLEAVQQEGPEYPDQIERLLARCREYREGSIPLTRIQAEIFDTAGVVVALHEKDLREFLENAENRLETIAFTTSQADAFDASLPVVAEVEERLRAYLAS